MTDRPIVFSAPMVRALLDGRKTMTRRYAWDVPTMAQMHRGEHQRPSPWHRVNPGDQLWVRESFSGRHEGWSVDQPGGPIWYWADGNPTRGDWTKPKPSIHMPRWASRLTLTVTATKIERLQEISERDAEAEGVEPQIMHATFGYGGTIRGREHEYARGFSELWDTLHGAGAWDANPEVVALTFTVKKRNIDALKDAA